MKKKLLSCAALMAACLAVSMPIGAKENPEPWSNTLSQSEEHVIKETGIDKRFDIGKAVSVKLDSAYVTKDTKVQLTENSLYKKVGKLIPAPFHFRSVTITKKSGQLIEFPDTLQFQENSGSLSLHGQLQCIEINRMDITGDTMAATYTGVLLAE